ncbi:MAG: hypothetical protein VB089_12430 [Anaerolineaceae bacterium]|nr:hypothetical protein [Anaerolineaceae bacterium]
MSNDNDILRDKDGYIYEKNWAGQYERKWDSWRQDYARDRAELEYQPSEHSWDGTGLYRQRETPSSSSSSTSDGEMALALIAFVVFLAISLIGVVIAATPIIAPILLETIENARKQGNLTKVKKLEPWGVLACLMAVLVVLGIACMIGFRILSVIAEFAQNNNSSISTMLIYFLAIATCLVAIALSFTTGISPTAIIYLLHKEAQLQSSGKSIAATRVRRLYRGIGIVAVGTLALTVIGIIVVIIVTNGLSFLSR